MSVPKYYAVDGKLSLPEQSKYVNIYENNSYQIITPDPGFTLGSVQIFTGIPIEPSGPSGGSQIDTDNLCAIIQKWPPIDITSLPGTIYSYGSNAFAYVQFEPSAITVPDQISIISDGAFQNSTISSIHIPDTVTYIGYRAFSQCYSLTSIRFPNGISEFGQSCCDGSGLLQNVELPNTLVIVPSQAFCNCQMLTEIALPDTVTTIQSGAFRNSGLTNIAIPNSVTVIENEAFAQCPALKQIQLSSNLSEISNCMFQGSGLTSIDIPDAVNVIQYYAFNSCQDLESVNMTDNITHIYYNAFEACGKLNNVALPANLTYIGQYAFSNCTGLTSITIPDTVTELEYGSFAYCTALETVTMPVNISNINMAFEGCENLRTFIIRCDSVPTVDPSVIMQGTPIYMNHDGTIYIEPISDGIDLDALVEQFKTDELYWWSNFADLIKPITDRNVT